MNWFLSSDLHIGHSKILEICSNRKLLGNTVEEHNEEIIRRHNSIVGPDDNIIYLGDLIMGSKKLNIPKYLPRLNGTACLLTGNHDFLPSEIKTPEKLKWYEDLYLNNGISQIAYGCVSLSMFTHDSQHDKIKLSHFPPASLTDSRDIEREQRYTHLRPVIKDDEILFHGHTHSQSIVSDHNVFHIGVDAHNYFPVSLDYMISLKGS